MKMKWIAGTLAAMCCISAIPAGTVTAEDSVNLMDYTMDYDAVNAADSIMFSGNQVLLTFDLMVQVEGCCIDPDYMEWEISGTADVTYTSDSFFESLSYEENYANTYCLITAESAGTVCVKGTEINPYTQTEIGTIYWNLNVGEDGHFDGTVNHDEPTELPDWIPQNFTEALEFNNTYGKHRVADGLICCVRYEQIGKDDYAIDASTSTAEYELLSQEIYEFVLPEKPDETDLEAYEAYQRELETLGISEYAIDNVEASFRYEVFVYKPISSGTLSLDWVAGFGLTNPYGVMHFDIAEDGAITQTDLSAWLPDSDAEWQEFYAAHKGVNIVNGYIVYCDQVAIDGGYQLYTAQDGIGKAELITEYTVSHKTVELLDGGTTNTLKVYRPFIPGTVKMTFTEKRSWVEDILSETVKCYEIGNDGSITEIAESDVIYPKPGDCDLDGGLTIVDTIQMQKYLLGQAELTCWQNADLNQDLRIDGFDLAMMKKMLLTE